METEPGYSRIISIDIGLRTYTLVVIDVDTQGIRANPIDMRGCMRRVFSWDL
jgi:hypothetical protein